MLIDTHFHLDDRRYEGERDEILKRAAEAGVRVLITIGTNLEDSRWVCDTVAGSELLYGTVGHHPLYMDEWIDGTESEFEDLARRERIVAVGEVGLDYHRGTEDAHRQHDVFRRMIQIGHRVEKPLVIHQRDAAQDCLRIMREENAEACGGVFHCFAGDQATARAALDMGFYIAVGGVLTYKNAQDLRDVIRDVPLDRLMLETDAPWLAPQKWRGKRNEPAYMREVLYELAKVKNVEAEQVEQATTENAKKLFRLIF